MAQTGNKKINSVAKPGKTIKNNIVEKLNWYSHFEKNGMARFKYPDQLEVAESWPVTSVGKVDKRALAVMAAERRAAGN